MPVVFEVRGGGERAILISVTRSSGPEVQDSMDELRELARTAGVEVIDAIVQHRRELNPRYLMGEGKMREVVIRALQLGATLLIFDQELSPAQVRSISEITELKVIDRSQLILDIFSRTCRQPRWESAGGTGPVKIYPAPAHGARGANVAAHGRDRRPRARRDQARDGPETGQGSDSQIGA